MREAAGSGKTIERRKHESLKRMSKCHVEAGSLGEWFREMSGDGTWAKRAASSVSGLDVGQTALTSARKAVAR